MIDLKPDLQNLIIVLEAEEAIMRAKIESSKTTEKLKRIYDVRRKPSSKDAWHCDPSEGQRFADDAQGWIIGGTIVALIAFAVIFAHSLDYWGM